MILLILKNQYSQNQLKQLLNDLKTTEMEIENESYHEMKDDQSTGFRKRKHSFSNSIMIIDVDEMKQRIPQIDINDILVAIKELMIKMKISNFNEFLFRCEEIEERICKLFSLSHFSEIGEGNFVSFCGKYLQFPFAQTTNDNNGNPTEKKIIKLHHFQREIEQQEISTISCVDVLNEMRYLENIYENETIKSLNSKDIIEHLIEINTFENCYFVEINMNCIVKLPLIKQDEIGNFLKQHITNENVVSALLLSEFILFSKYNSNTSDKTNVNDAFNEKFNQIIRYHLLFALRYIFIR